MYHWFNLVIATCIAAFSLAMAHDRIERRMKHLKKK